MLAKTNNLALFAASTGLSVGKEKTKVIRAKKKQQDKTKLNLTVVGRTSAIPVQCSTKWLSYQAKWELVTLYRTVHSEECKHERLYI